MNKPECLPRKSDKHITFVIWYFLIWNFHYLDMEVDHLQSKSKQSNAEIKPFIILYMSRKSNIFVR